MALNGKLLQPDLIVVGVIVLILAASVASKSNSTCERRCGSVEIPYPFGTTKECSLDSTFLIPCKNNVLSLGSGMNVNEISVLDGELRVSNPVASICKKKKVGRSPTTCASKNTYSRCIYDRPEGITVNYSGNSALLKLSKFRISDTGNKITAVGCGVYSFIQGYKEDQKAFTTGCLSLCTNNASDVVNGSCAGIGCCQTSIPTGATEFNLRVRVLNDDNTKTIDEGECAFGFIVDQKAYNFSTLDFEKLKRQDTVPLVLDWAVGNDTCKEAEKNNESYACKAIHSYCYNSSNGPGYRCNCSDGYKYGNPNPYLPDGCQDTNECELTPYPCAGNATCNNTEGSYTCTCRHGYEGDGRTSCTLKAESQPRIIPISLGAGVGMISMFVLSSWLYFALQKRKMIKLREKFFQQNGGLILQQRLGRQEGSKEIVKIFTVDELKKATKNYDDSRIIGRGGFGIVYKGFLADNKIVAIKKSKIEDGNQIEQFINEIIVLSQINHENVVKLLGCCLETQVPLLVYEFVPKGTLFKHIHQERNGSTLSWETCLRIAAAAAEAIRYLHSAAIIHRDVKSTNILLDDDFTAKVSDFGTSRMVPRDQMQLATVVQGTLGYLDPEYMQTNQLTEKSDVYSFGVVLVELLTGKEALSFARSEEQRSLAMYFISSIKEERLFEIIENYVVAEGNKEQIQQFVKLATSCLAVKGEERPTMREVAMELEEIRKMRKHPWVNLDANSEEVEHLLGETCEANKYGESSSSIATGYHHSLNIDHGTYTLGDGR